MAKITIPIVKIKHFLELISCEGQTEDGGKSGKVITEFIINVFDNLMEAKAVDKVGKLFANVSMQATVLEPGQIIIGDVNIFEKYLSVFNGKDLVTITQDNGILKIERDSPRKMAKFSTVSPDNIETHKTAGMINDMWKFNESKTELGTERTKLTNVIIANAEDFSQVVKDSKVVGEQHYPFSILTNGAGMKILKVEVGSIQTSMGVIKSLIPARIQSEELSNKYAYGFDNVFTSLKGEVKMFTAPNMPLWVIKEGEDYFVRYMLTPCVD